MANTRFLRAANNRTTNAAALLMNGGGGPPIVQNPAYPMSNLMNNDRGSVWASGAAGAGGITVHIDMGSQQTIKALGCLGLVAAVGGVMPSTLAIGYRTAAQGYSLTGYTSAGAAGLLFPQRADVYAELAPTGMRYLEFVLNPPGGGWLNGFSLGKFLAAAIVEDLGIIYSPGSERGLVVPQIRRETQSGFVHVTRTGLNYETFNLDFRAIATSTVVSLQLVAASEFPFTYIDQLDVPYECLMESSEWSRLHRWSLPDLWDASLRMRQLA